MDKEQRDTTYNKVANTHGMKLGSSEAPAPQAARSAHHDSTYRMAVPNDEVTKGTNTSKRPMPQYYPCDGAVRSVASGEVVKGTHTTYWPVSQYDLGASLEIASLLDQFASEALATVLDHVDEFSTLFIINCEVGELNPLGELYAHRWTERMGRPLSVKITKEPNPRIVRLTVRTSG